MSAKTKRTIGFSPFGHKVGDITPFESLFTHKKDITDGFDGIDCLILWGGTDVHPSYYREPPHKYNYAPHVPSDRDVLEWKAMLYCKAHNIPMIGVCRGAQYLCVFAGGTLAQDTNKHGYDHEVCTDDGREFWVTSSHHQMMNPYHVPHKLLAWSKERKSEFYENGWGSHIETMAKNPEPEIVYFPEIRGLAIQGHPEYHHAGPTFRNYCVEKAEQLLF